MKNSSGLNAAKPASIPRAIGGVGPRGIRRAERPAILGIATLAALLVCCVHAAVGGANTPASASIGYLCWVVVLFGCAAAFWTHARLARGTLYIRWSLISAAALLASIGFLPSFTEVILHTSSMRGLQTACFNSSEALYMLAVVLFFAGGARLVLIVDMQQAILFVVLRFNLIYSPVTRDHFTLYHLFVGQLMALFLFLVAMVAWMGAATREELSFLRVISLFFGVRLVTYFLSDQVSYVWLHYVNGSLWDVAGTVLLAGFTLHLLYTSYSAKVEAPGTTPLRLPSVVVRSLMPSFLALVNLMLGLLILRVSIPLAVGAISISLVCYVARTVLLQAQAAKEKIVLQSRNKQLEGLAIRDPLTGIGNRRSLAEAYNRLQTLADSKSLSILLIDIDRFKQANDSHGHLHGDRVLISLARKLESVVADVVGGHCARLGGDEFSLLLPDVSSAGASTFAEELRALFAAHACGVEDGSVSLSIGIASLHASRDLPLETLISYADQALYRAKLQGRNRVEVQPAWDPATAAADSTVPLQLELQRIGG